MMPQKPKCPQCGRVKAVEVLDTNTFWCQHCRGPLFDRNPDEGGTHDDRDPSARIIRDENKNGKKKKA
jgi:ribosomal protein L37AE/L43A